MSQNAKHMNRDGKPSAARSFNAVIGVALIIFFLVHVLLGTAFWYGIIGDDLAIAAWVGVGLVIIHVFASCATTVATLSNKERIPTRRRKQRLLIKWLIGLLIIALMVVHLTVGDLVGNIYYTKGALIALALMVLICIHVYMSVKATTHDLQLSPEVRKPFRIGVIFCCAFLVTLFGLVAI